MPERNFFDLEYAGRRRTGMLDAERRKTFVLRFLSSFSSVSSVNGVFLLSVSGCSILFLERVRDSEKAVLSLFALSLQESPRRRQEPKESNRT